jgi:hypothetical protein
MTTSISSSTSSAGANGAKWADSVFSKLDTKKQGYLDKADLTTALTAAGGDKQNGAANVDDVFSALDADSDGKVTKSELTTAMTKLSDQLSAQHDASRVAGAQAGAPHGHRGGGGGGGEGGKGAVASTGATGSASATSSTTTYNAQADANNDGTVSTEEETAYEKAKASGAGSTVNSPSQQRDPAHELAHALNLLKAYADDNSGGTSAGTNAAGSISVSA